MSARKLHVVVLMGGPSAEHEVSLASGRVIIEHLNPSKYEIQPMAIGRSPALLASDKEGGDRSLQALPVSVALKQAKEGQIDVVFIALHGEFGEDGRLQGLLDLLGIPYTGSGVLASSLAMDKVKSAELFRAHGLLVPPYTHFWRWEWEERPEIILAFLTQALPFPWVVKPADRGSSVGVSIASTQERLGSAIEEAFEHSEHVMVQQHISGVEVTCAVLHEDPRCEPWPLPPTQILPKSKAFFDYDAKYTPGTTEEITPPRLPQALIARIQALAVKAHKILDCYGMSRTDMIVQGESLYILETNTIPGMTETSLYPQAAKAIGLELGDLLDRLIAAALRRHGFRNRSNLS